MTRLLVTKRQINLCNCVNIRGRLLHIFMIFLLNLIIIFTGNDVEAENDYVEALKEVLQVAPKGDIEAQDELEELEKPDVEFSMKDMKFLNVTLKDSIILALQNNYDIKIAKLEPIIKEKDITSAKSVFDTVLKTTGELVDTETPSNSGVQVGIVGQEPAKFERDTKTIDASLEKPLVTGAMFTLGFNIERSDVNPVSAFTLENPVTAGTIEAKITQPLLRNAGIFYNRSEIYIARNNKEKSVLELKETAIEVINSAQTAYWELVKVIEDLRVKNKSLERAKDLLRKNKIQVEVGTLAPIDVLEAEEGVASQLEAVIVAENEVKNKEDELKQVINLSNDSILSDVTIIPLDKASFEIKDISLDESIKIAFANRPELFKQSLDIANAKIKVKQRRNELLPKLNAEAGIRYSGLSDTYGNAVDRIFSEDFQSQFFGLTLEVPLGNRKARSNYSKAKLEASQFILNKSKEEQDVVVEVRKAVREIKTNSERIKATEKARELAQARLEAEEKKFKVGRSTSLEVIRAQEDLAIAEGKATDALVDYQISLGDLDAVQGMILERNNIIIEDENLEVKKELTSKES